MYAPATPLPAAPLAPVGIAASSGANEAGAALVVPPAHTALRVRSFQLNVLADHRASVTGTLLAARKPAPAGLSVSLQARTRGGWRTLTRSDTKTGGRFHLRYLPRLIGSRMVRLRFAGVAADLPSVHRLGRLNAYRQVEASWYGGGGSLACGGWLTSATLGVASRTLPCGTLVTLRYDGHVVRVPVVDRGPYVFGREFDLTEATKRALGFVGVGQVWSTS